MSKYGRNPPPPENYVKPAPPPAPPPPPNREFKCTIFGLKETRESVERTKEWKDNLSNRPPNRVIPKDVYNRLSPNRQQVIDTLASLTHPDEDVWVRQVYAAVNDGFFEKAGRLIWPHSTRLARRMLDGLERDR